MKEQKLRQLIREIIEAEVDADGNLVDFSGGDWKSQVGEYDHIHFFIEPQMADQLEDKLIMAGIDMVDNYPYDGAHLLRVSLGSNAAADLAKAERIVGQSAKKGSPEQLEELDTPQQMMSKASSTEDRLDAIFEFQSAIGDLVMTGVIKPGGVIARSLNKVFMTLEKRVKAEDKKRFTQGL